VRVGLPVTQLLFGPGGDRRASTMFQPPAKKTREPRMRQSAVDARGGAAPTGAVPAGTFSTPVRLELCRTRPQFLVHGGSPIPSPGGAGRGFAAALGAPHASAWLWPSNMVAAPTACDFGTRRAIRALRVLLAEPGGINYDSHLACPRGIQVQFLDFSQHLSFVLYSGTYCTNSRSGLVFLALNPKPYILNPKPYILNPKP
jgi:hypothetical protein